MGGTLDFLVIGAQKAGTTTLHALLRQHPDLFLPGEKEAPFFNRDDRWERGLDWFLAEFFAEAPAVARWGKVTPHYMLGSPEVPVERIADRVAATVPEVRIVAVLRDPVTRALSHWRMSTRRGTEKRPFPVMVEQELAPDRLAEARRAPTETNSYLTQGEYGRILGLWADRLPGRQIHAELTADLERRPAEVATAIHRFLGVAPREPRDVGRLHGGGERTRVDPTAGRALRAMLAEHLPLDEAGLRTFDYWFAQWNIVGGEPVRIDPEVERRLREHYAADAQLLRRLGHPVPGPAGSARPAGEPAAEPARRRGWSLRSR